MRSSVLFRFRLLAAFAVVGAAGWGRAATAPSAEQVAQVLEQNAELRRRLDEQRKEIDRLRGEVDELTRDGRRHQRRLDELGETPATAAPAADRVSRPAVIVSGQGSAGFFSSGPDGLFPNSEFRLHEARLAVEARVSDGVYGFFELNLAERENTSSRPYLGEIYVDFEDFGRWFGLPAGALALRAGRFDVPFGEEYLARDAIDNPLVSHSLADFWGVDEGVEFYGRAGGLTWIFAVQNGGRPYHQDFNADKSVAFRLGGDPAPWLHLGASAMRTGRLDPVDDTLSEIWFGNGVFVSIGAPATTTHFSAEFVQLEARARWASGHVHGAIGRAWYDDDDTARDNSRAFDFGSLEVVQELGANWFGAGRFSRITVDGGYPLVGQGTVDEYLLGGALTTRLNRLSLGLGRRFGEPLVWKLEYSWETGRTTTGEKRDGADTLSSEVAVRF